MDGSAAVVRALLGIQVTLAAIALALIASDARAVVMLLALLGFAVTGSALPPPARSGQLARDEGALTGSSVVTDRS